MNLEPDIGLHSLDPFRLGDAARSGEAHQFVVVPVPAGAQVRHLTFHWDGEPLRAGDIVQVHAAGPLAEVVFADADAPEHETTPVLAAWRWFNGRAPGAGDAAGDAADAPGHFSETPRPARDAQDLLETLAHRQGRHAPTDDTAAQALAHVILAYAENLRQDFDLSTPLADLTQSLGRHLVPAMRQHLAQMTTPVFRGDAA